MASVHRDPRYPKGVWYCLYRLADGRRAFRSTGKRNKREAEIVCQTLQQIENEAATGDLTKERVTELANETLRRVGLPGFERITVKAWLASREGHVSAATHQSYQRIIREFLQYLAPRGETRRLEAITESDIRGFVGKLRGEGRAPTTVNKLVRGFLSVPFEKARRRGLIKFNPIAATDPEKGKPATRDVFSPEQVVQLLRCADRDWTGAILLAYGCGGRLQDIANLRWSALDTELGVVSFRQRKTDRSVLVGLHLDFLDWITKQSVSEDPDAYVFPTLANRSGGGGKGLSMAFERIMEQAGVRSRLIRERSGRKGRSLRALSFHSFRHSAASAVFNQAALREITRRVTGHAAGGVVDRYIHEDLQAIRQASQLVPRLPKIK